MKVKSQTMMRKTKPGRPTHQIYDQLGSLSNDVAFPATALDDIDVTTGSAPQAALTNGDALASAASVCASHIALDRLKRLSMTKAIKKVGAEATER